MNSIRHNFYVKPWALVGALTSVTSPRLSRVPFGGREAIHR
jgi:hypothetical protein